MDLPCHAGGHSCHGASCQCTPNPIMREVIDSQAPDSAKCASNYPQVCSVAGYGASNIQYSCTSCQKQSNINPNSNCNHTYNPNMVENVRLDATPHVRFDLSYRGNEPLYRSLLFCSPQSPLQGCRRHCAIEPVMPASCSHSRDGTDPRRCASPAIEKPSSCPGLTSIQNLNQNISKTVMLYNWYLIKPHGFCNSEIAVGGFLTSRALEQERFVTEAIIKRLEERKLVAKDGIIVNLIGTMDGCSTLSNGFSIQMVHLFLSGFPHIWNLLVGIEIPGNDNGMTSSTLMSQMSLGGKGNNVCKNLFFECKEYDDHHPYDEDGNKTPNDPETVNQEQFDVGSKENPNAFSTSLGNVPSSEEEIDYGRILESLKSDKSAINLRRTSSTNPENNGPQLSLAPNIISEGPVISASPKGTRWVTESIVADEVASLSRKRKVSFHDDEHDFTGSPSIDQYTKIITKKALIKPSQRDNVKAEPASLVIDAKAKTGNMRNQRAQSTANTTKRGKRKKRFRIVKLRRSNKKKVPKVESNSKKKTLSSNEHNNLITEDAPNIQCEDSPEDTSISHCDKKDGTLEVGEISNVECEDTPREDDFDSPTQFGHDVIHEDSQTPADPHSGQSSGGSSEDESSRLVSVESINGPNNHTAKKKKMKLAILPPLPSPTVSVSRQLVSKAFGLKTSRSGRLLVPPLAHWRNQSLLRDSDGGIIAIENGSEDGMKADTGRFNFKPPVEPRARKLQKWLSVTATECFSRKFKSRFKVK